MSTGPWESEPQTLRRKDIPKYLATAIVLFVAILYAFPWIRDTARDWNTNQLPSWEGVFANSPEARTKPICDIDTYLIHNGLVAAPHFTDTFRWWHGVWVGQVVFYRPISSYAFWIDWKLFGNHEPRYLALAILLHLVAVWQFVRLSYTLFRYFEIDRPAVAALISGLIFVDGLWVLGIRQQTVQAVFGAWKNMPEALVTLFFCMSLTSYINLKSSMGKIGSAGKVTRPVGASGILQPSLWFLASCASKEAGILMPLLVFWLELPELRQPGDARRGAVKRMGPLLASLLLFLVIRTLSLHTFVGFRYGSNGSWMSRITDNLLGTAGEDLRTGRWMQLMLALSLTAACFLMMEAYRQPSGPERSRRIRRALAAPIAIPLVLSFGFNPAAPFALRPVVMVIQFWDAGNLTEELGICLFLIGLISAFRFRPRLAAFGYSWVLVTLALLLMTPSSIHRAYLMEGGFAILLAAGLTSSLARPSAASALPA